MKKADKKFQVKHARHVGEIPEDPDPDSENVEARTWKWRGAQIISQQTVGKI